MLLISYVLTKKAYVSFISERSAELEGAVEQGNEMLPPGQIIYATFHLKPVAPVVPSSYSMNGDLSAVRHFLFFITQGDSSITA